MSWSGSTGSQTFSRTDGTRTGSTTWQLADAAGRDIVASDHDVHDQDIADGVNSCLKKDGGNTATAHLPMGGFYHSNVGAAAGPLNYARLDDVVSQKGIWAPTVGGTANAITLTTGYSLTSYVAGQRFTFIPTATSSSTVTINVDGNGTKNVYTAAGQALTSGEIIANIMCSVVYDGTQFILQSSAANPVAMSVGVVMAWPMTTVPSGWLECDGTAVSRTTYSALFAVIGTNYGTGDGSTTFNLPNYKDYFLRGFDASGTEASSRTDRGDGTTGASVGTKQASAFLRHNHTASVTDPGHTHNMTSDARLAGNGGGATPTGFNITGDNDTTIGSAATKATASNTTGISVTVANTAANDSTSETRPKNITVKWIILALPTATYALGTGYVAQATAFHTGGIPAQVSTDGTDTTPSVTETYIAEVFVAANCTCTGISIFNGSAVAGNIKAAIATSSGAVLVQTASTAASGTDAYQDLALSASTTLYGPATYYVLLQCNNTGYRFNSHTFGRFRASKKTGETYGTFTTITPPTTFTTGVGPIATLY